MTFIKHTILFALFFVVLFHPLRSQTFQQVYTSLNGTSPYTAAYTEVVQNTSSVGYGIATVGSPKDNGFSPYGLLTFFDLGGVPLNSSKVQAPFPVVRGQDLCEAPWNPDHLVAVFANGTQTIVVCVDETTFTPVWIRVIPDLFPEAIIPASTGIGDGVYISGVNLNSSSPNRGDLVVHGIDPAGNTIWSNSSHVIAFTGVPLTDMYGFDIEYDQQFEFGVVGVGRESGTNNFVPFYVQIDENGTVKNVVTYYTDPAVPPKLIRLRAVEKHPNNGHLVVGGDIAYGTGSAPFVMEVDDNGIPVWNSYYVVDPNPYFYGKGRIEDIDFDENNWFQASGYYTNSGNTGARAFAFPFDPTGGASQIVEYQGTSVTSTGNKFWGNTWSPVLETFIHSGEYQNAIYPWNANNSQWLVSTDQFALTGTGCDDVWGVTGQDDVVIPEFVNWIETNGPQAFFDPNITYTGMNINFTSQCVTPKRSLEDEAASAAAMQVSYLSGSDQIQLNYTGDSELEWEVRVVDMQGQVVWKGNSRSRNLQLDASGLASGIYLVAWEMANGQVGTEKIALVR